jgi:hypothetical protein
VERYRAAVSNPHVWDPKKGAALRASSVFAAIKHTYHILAQFDPTDTKYVLIHISSCVQSRVDPGWINGTYLRQNPVK